jgi:glutamate racemase
MTDSGLGGLSVLQKALEELPNESFVFLADQLFMPYGDKPVHEISNRIVALAHWFHEYSCKALVLACNTATAAAADAIRNQYANWPVVGIEPAVKPAAMMTKSGTVGILATANTLASDRFRSLVSRFESVANVVAQPCHGLVELIESVPIDKQQVATLLKPHLSKLIDSGADVIVLGCTHYPFVREDIQRLVGSDVQIIETGFPVARQLRNRLDELGLLNHRHEENSSGLGLTDRVQFYTTGDPLVLKQGLLTLLGQCWDQANIRAIQI